MPVSPLAARAPRTHMPALDGLRGIAVLLTMLLHFSQPYFGVMWDATPVDAVFQRIAEAGWIGVDLFFVLSGFLITGILLDTKHQTGYFRSFYARRALRILPLYYAFLVARLWMWPAVYPSGAPLYGEWTDQLWLWTHLANVPIAAQEDWSAAGAHLSHFWSLAVEEQFYLFWPAVVLVTSRRALTALCLGMVPVAAGVGIFLGIGLANPIAAYVILPARMDSLAIGALAAVAVRGPGGLGWARQHAGPALRGAGVVLAGLAFWRRGLDLHDVVVQLVGFPALAVFFGAIIVRAISAPGDSRLPRVLGHSTLRFFGRYSYALYVLHLPLVPFVSAGVFSRLDVPTLYGSHLPEQLLYMLVAGGLSVVAALLSWNLLERHFLELKDRFPYGEPAGAAPTTGDAGNAGHKRTAAAVE